MQLRPDPASRGPASPFGGGCRLPKKQGVTCFNFGIRQEEDGFVSSATPFQLFPERKTALKMWQVLIITHPNPLPLPAPASRPLRARSLPLGLHISRWGFLDGAA